MKKADVVIGGRYFAKLGVRDVIVRIDGAHPFGGWIAVNEATGKMVRIRTAMRLHGEARK